MKHCWYYLISLAFVACGPQPPAAQAPPPQSPVEPTQEQPQGAAVVIEPPAAETPEQDPVSTIAVGDITSADGWTTFHGGPARTGASAAPALKAPRVLWSARVGIQGWLNGPIVLGQQLVIVPSSGTAHNQPDPEDGVYALDFKTGRRAWHAHFDQDANGVAATKTHVFATSDDGHVYALDVKTGRVAWKHKGKGKMYSHPLLVDGKVVVGDAMGNLRALNAKDGSPVWSKGFVGAIRGGAAADDKAIYVTSQGGDAAKLSFSGKVLWKKRLTRPPWGGRGKPEALEIYSPPVLVGGLMIIPFARDTYYKDVPALMALDARTGRERWRSKGPGQWGNLRVSPVSVAGALVYAEPYSGDIVGIASTTGRMLWRKKAGPCFFPSWSSPAAAGEVAYVARFDGSLHAVRAASGKQLWQVYLGDKKLAGKPRPAFPKSRYGCEWKVPVGDSLFSPVAVANDGTVLVGSGEGFLYALGD